MPGQTFSFGQFQIDLSSRRLRCNGEAVAVTVKAFDILAALVEDAGRVVDKDELMRRVWPDAIVEEANLSQQIFLLRRVLGEDAKDHRFIATVPRRGYRFVAQVTQLPDANGTRPAAADRSSPPAVDVAGPPLKLSLILSPGSPLALAPSRPFTLSPDGRLLAYIAHDEATTVLAVRHLDRHDVVKFARTAGATSPFFSPDSRWIGYFANGLLCKVPAAGGTPIEVCEAGAECRGASWSCRDEILFAPTPASGLVRVPADGGAPRLATTLDFAHGERTHRWPEVLPGGHHVLFTVAHAGSASFEEADLVVASLENGERRTIHRYGSSARYVPTGHLVYMRGESLMAAPFDLAQLAVQGSSMPVVDAVMTQPTGSGYFSFSQDGCLVYLTGEARDVIQRLVWTADGAVETTQIAARLIEEPRLAPDGTRIALGIRKATSDIWTHDIEQGTLTRLTFDGDNFAPIWSPDGMRLTYSSNRQGPCQIFSQALDEPEPTLLVGGEHDLVPGSWSPDGTQLLFTEHNPHSGAGVWVCAPSSDAPPRPLVRSRGNAFAPACSPDGRSFAYASDESGQLEVYVSAFPDAANRVQISVDGGSESVWSPDGRSLYFRRGSQLLAREMDRARPQHGSKPRIVADGPFQPGATTGLPNYDVARDGRVLLIAQSSAVAHPEQLSVTVGWFADIRHRLA
ncbi:MAG: winged helix-turn-helix domain-containing protein [Acidobacteriota bacterium]|nr:winged helix-turn-helix domain-containing protein [Acidobacteriota bacterium]